jgi:hypothetical protein
VHVKFENDGTIFAFLKIGTFLYAGETVADTKFNFSSETYEVLCEVKKTNRTPTTSQWKKKGSQSGLM